MLEQLKRTVKHTAIFALGSIGAKLVGFVLLPIYTKEISVADYGVLGLFEMIDLMGEHVLSLSLQTALFRWYSLSDDTQRRRSYVFSVFVFLCMVLAAAFLLLLPTRHQLSAWLLNTPQYGNLFIYLLCSTSFSILNKIPLSLLRIEEKSVFYTVLILFQFILTLLLNIYLVAYLKWGIEGVLIAQAIGSGAVLLALLPYLIGRMVARLDRAELQKMIVFSYPMVFAAIASTVLSLGDRFMLTRLASLEVVGLYSLGYKFSNILKVFVIDSFLLGLPIVGWKVVKEDKAPRRFFAKTMTYLVLMLMWLGLALSAFARGIIHQFALSTAYWDAHLVVPVLTAGLVFMGIQRVLLFELQIPKKTGYIPLVIGSAAVLNVLLNLVLIPPYGMMGASVATVLAYLWSAGLAYMLVQKYYPIQYEVKRMLVLGAVGTALYFLTVPLNDLSLLGRIVGKGVIVLSMPGVLYLIGFYEPVELQRIRGSVKKWSGRLLRRR